MGPVVEIFQQQQVHRCNLAWLHAAANRAVPLCLALARTSDAPLATLSEIEVSIVSDEAIARVHADFMSDPTPTDVITFHHGEIIISADTAHRVALEVGHSLDRELCLYVIHGLMHLGGWDDHEPVEAAAMKAAQEQVLDLVAPKTNAPHP
jgi:probable rRNA maturation factor